MVSKSPTSASSPAARPGFDGTIERGLRTVISQAQGFKGWKVNRGIKAPSATC